MKDHMREFGRVVLTILLLIVALAGGRLAFHWLSGDDTWHLLKLSHDKAPVYVEQGYADDISCIFAGEHYLETLDQSINSYQCLQHCNGDHSICEGVIDGKSSASEQKAAEEYINSLNLR